MSADLDKAIDRAVREMLDVEPPAGLRGRGMDRIESPRHVQRWIWLAVPVAVAAAILLAVSLPRDRALPPPAVRTAANMELPAPTIAVPVTPPSSGRTIIPGGTPGPRHVETAAA